MESSMAVVYAVSVSLYIYGFQRTRICIIQKYKYHQLYSCGKYDVCFVIVHLVVM